MPTITGSQYYFLLQHPFHVYIFITGSKQTSSECPINSALHLPGEYTLGLTNTILNLSNEFFIDYCQKLLIQLYYHSCLQNCQHKNCKTSGSIPLGWQIGHSVFYLLISLLSKVHKQRKMVLIRTHTFSSITILSSWTDRTRWAWMTRSTRNTRRAIFTTITLWENSQIQNKYNQQLWF